MLNDTVVAKLCVVKRKAVMPFQQIRKKLLPDFDNIMQHISPISALKKSSKEKNEIKLNSFFSQGEFNSVISTNYGVKLVDLYNDLPHVNDPSEPFRPIPEEKMEYYLAFIDQQHPDNERG